MKPASQLLQPFSLTTADRSTTLLTFLPAGEARHRLFPDEAGLKLGSGEFLSIGEQRSVGGEAHKGVGA